MQETCSGMLKFQEETINKQQQKQQEARLKVRIHKCAHLRFVMHVRVYIYVFVMLCSLLIFGGLRHKTKK